MITKTIKNHQDCRNILESMQINNENDDYYHEFEGLDLNIPNDPHISMINGGGTRVYRNSETEWTTFSSGLNWQDQQPESHDLNYMIKYLFKCRKTLNDEYKTLLSVY